MNVWDNLLQRPYFDFQLRCSLAKLTHQRSPPANPPQHLPSALLRHGPGWGSRRDAFAGARVEKRQAQARECSRASKSRGDPRCVSKPRNSSEAQKRRRRSSPRGHPAHVRGSGEQQPGGNAHSPFLSYNEVWSGGETGTLRNAELFCENSHLKRALRHREVRMEIFPAPARKACSSPVASRLAGNITGFQVAPGGCFRKKSEFGTLKTGQPAVLHSSEGAVRAPQHWHSPLPGAG